MVSRNTRRDDMFHVFNQADNDGFHAIKNEKGDIIANVCDTEEQARITLDVMGLPSDDLETVFDQQTWERIGLDQR